MTQITVGIPVRNGMPHLPGTLASVLHQTFSDFKVLIIDDGSTDESAAYLESVDDPRVTVIHQPNQGITVTLNRMLAMLKSGWLVRQDADDISLPNRLERIFQCIQRFPEGSMIYSQVAHLRGNSMQGQLLTTPADQTGLRSFLSTGYLPSICHPSIALRVDAALAVGGYRFDLHVEDQDIYWRIGLRFDVHMIPEVLLGYRMTPGSISDQNIRTQTTNLLYVQYLLLSELWHRTAASYEEVLPVLQGMVDRRHLAFREHMRCAMISAGAHRYGGFLLEVAKAFSESPRAFAHRFLWHGAELARVGISPETFKAQSAQLWPSG
jgi:glycosyltransferase involved in cell wall biosynthesis